MGGQGLTVRAGVVATRAYRVVELQGYLGFEERTRRDFAKLGGQAKSNEGPCTGENGDNDQSSELASAKYESDVNYTRVARCEGYAARVYVVGHNCGAKNVRRVLCLTLKREKMLVI